MLGNVFKAYDIRGKHPSPLSEKLAWQIGHGVSAFLRNDATQAGLTTPMMSNIVVGHDMRTSSPTLVESLEDGITAQGGNVIDVGLVDTPFIYFAVNRLDCAGGVMVTASHNPPEYNGMKVSGRRAKPIGEATGLAEVRRLAAMSDPAKAPQDPAERGRIEERDLWDAYVEHVRGFLDGEAISKNSLKVVVDASNGMAGTTLPEIFGEGGSEIDGLEIIELHFDNASGEFAHEPNPLVPANLEDLQAAVSEHGAHLGICFDGDADRCVVVDERGEAVGCDLITAWLAREFLQHGSGGAVVYDLRSSKAVKEEIEKAGGKPVRGRVGHVFMKQAMAEHGGVFGGELSGHFYFRDNFNADSGVIAMASVVGALARSGKKMSGIVKPIARYAQSGEINFEVEEKDQALAELKERYAGRGEIDELDGVTIDCFESEGWWANVRKSNTEPLLRLNLEARDLNKAQAMVEELSPHLGERVDH